MKKQTTSDDVKTALIDMYGGAEEDWKRLSRKKNTDGETVREFENAAIGQRCAVIEDLEGKLRIESAPEQAKRLTDIAAEAFARSPSGAVVDQVMDIVLNGNDEGNNEVPDALLKKCDPKALASNFYFTIHDYEDMGGLFAVVAPKGRGTDESKSSYSVVPHIFPEAEYVDDCVEGWWAFPAAVDTPLKLAQKLVDAGFEYKADYQDDEIKPALKGLKLPGAGAPPKKGPQP